MRSDLLEIVVSHPWFRWGVAIVVVAAGAATLAAVRSFLHRRLVRAAPLTENRLDDLLADLVGRTRLPFLAALPTLITCSILDLPESVERVARGLALLLCLIQAGAWGSTALREIVERRFAAATGAAEDPARRTVARMAALGARVAMWIVLLLLALDNAGVDITALITGLGVGGVAVALATQNVLGDVFASVSILLDKPFVPGDFIVVGDFMGTVEHIGIKTTRVRSLTGEQIIFSNADLLQSRVRNYKRMADRRVLLRLGVVYQTPCDQLERIPGLLRQIVEAQEGVRFDRAHFASFGDFALTFEVVFYVLSPDYNRYMDIQQRVHMAVFRRFEQEGIAFAYPTQTLFLENRMERGALQVPVIVK